MLPTLFLVVSVAVANVIRVEFGADFPAGLPLLAVTRRFGQLQTTSPLVVSLGNSQLASQCNVSATTVTQLGPEGYLLAQPKPGLVCVFGNFPLPNAVNAPTDVNRGLLYGTYALLGQLGLRFFHPLEATLPFGASALPAWSTVSQRGPHFAVRGFHYHTEHPLELCEFLQGVDAGSEPWHTMAGEFESYVEWLVANRQNALQYVLLELGSEAATWSTARQDRIRRIVNTAQAFGVAVGADFAIAVEQQHAWHMVTDPSKAHAQIDRAVAWLRATNFSYISTENGASEFTHSSCTDMLDYMNYLTQSAAAQGIATFIKCHCSSGQTCPHHNDPRTGQNVNFNFLPMLANTSLGVMPHTVQLYRLNDPAPTYGNTNFSYMQDFLEFEASRRPVLFHPETAYWVNYDINVPLLLPIYADSRIADVQSIVASERRGVAPIAGQIVFTSGWEWGYWLNDVIAARTAWEAPDSSRSTASWMAQFLQPLAEATFASAADQAAFVQLLLDTVQAERDLLVFGAKPFSKDTTGIAFLTGWDSWASLAQLAGDAGFAFAKAALTNANKVSFAAVRFGVDNPPFATFRPLLVAMAKTFAALSARYATLLQSANANGLMAELADAMQMTALRAEQVAALYDVAKTGNSSMLSVATRAIGAAQQVSARRMAHYRAPITRIAAWRPNPTAYSFTYLWSVKSLQYWWRDLHIVRHANFALDLSPCLDNIVDPVNVAIGEGLADSLARLLFEALKFVPGTDWFDDCLSAPTSEPIYS